MFSSFKNIVNSSLQELDRLGESSFGLPQQQQQQQQQQNNGYHGHNRDSSVDARLSSSKSYGELGSQLQGAAAGSQVAGSRRSPNMHARNHTIGDGRSSPLPFFSPPTGHALPPRMNSPGVTTGSALSTSRPVSSSGAATEATSNSRQRERERRDSSESFPDFGFSNLKRSFSGMNKATLDLSGLRSSFDAGRPTTSGGSPSTPSREFPSSSQPVRPSLSVSGGRRRKTSARSFSVSGITGPYTPDTMMRQDPFFFTALQALPDDLKIAAFTPLPTEDDDEYLEGIDNELNSPAAAFPSALPAISTSGLRKYGSASFSGPSSAPAAGFMRSSFGSPAAVKSPLLESNQSILGRLEDHVEEEEKPSATPSANPSPFATSTPLPNSDQNGSETEQAASTAAESSAIRPEQATHPLMQEPESALGLDVPSPTFSQPPSTDIPSKKASETPATSNDNHPLAIPPSVQATSRPVSPALPPKHESLQARLARLAKSRASATVSDSQPASSLTSATSQTPTTVVSPTPAGHRQPTPPQTITPQTVETSKASNREEVSSPVLPSQGDTKAQSLEDILKRYIPIPNINDTAALESYLQQRTALASTSAEQTKKGISNATASSESDKVTIATLEAELKEVRATAARAEARAKEEEEKKAKSISLLKAVRQKLLKAEKDKEELEIMRDAYKSSEDALKAELRQRTQRFESELMSTRSGQEREISRLKASFDREAQSIRVAADREASAKRGQYELDMLNLRSAQTRELQQRDARIGMLETSLRDLRREKDSLFEQWQAKQAEVESATTSQERAQVAYDELQYELKDARDRIAALQEEVHSFKKARLDQTRDEGHTRRLLSELESNNADRIQGYEDRIRTLEKERSEAEESMAKKLQDKLREVEKMRREIERRDAENSEETSRREERQERIERAEKQNLVLQDKVNALEMLLNEARLEISRVKEEQSTTQELLADQTRRVAEVEGRNEDLQAKEGQLRISNKNLREELRKVQAGILLAEKSRNPGVGYFSSFSQSAAAGSPSASSLNLANPGGAKSPPLPSSPGLGSLNGADSSYHGRRESTTSLASEGAIARAGGGSEDEALNFEYIRNVILQFLEHKEMRPHLVGVLGVILHFTPAETRRLTSKASA